MTWNTMLTWNMMRNVEAKRTKTVKTTKGRPTAEDVRCFKKKIARRRMTLSGWECMCVEQDDPEC